MSPPRTPCDDPAGRLCVEAIRLAGSYESAVVTAAASLAVLATLAHTDRALLHTMLDSALDECKERTA